MQVRALAFSGKLVLVGRFGEPAFELFEAYRFQLVNERRGFFDAVCVEEAVDFGADFVLGLHVRIVSRGGGRALQGAVDACVDGLPLHTCRGSDGVGR